jgi:hypothetical protein
VDKGAMTNDGKFSLDAKLNVPFILLETNRLEIERYFFVGTGIKQDVFSELNAVATVHLTIKLFSSDDFLFRWMLKGG